MVFFAFLVFVGFVYLFYDFLKIRNLKTIQFWNLFSKKNEVATYNHRVHRPMIELALENASSCRTGERLSFLEVGAGDGQSTLYFINYLSQRGLNFSYVANEYFEEYLPSLIKLLPQKNIKIMPFERLHLELNEKFDVILLTCSSQMTLENIESFNQLCKKGSVIVTINPFEKNLTQYFRILKSKPINLFLKCMVCEAFL